MSQKALWTGYYRLIYLAEPNIHYFGYPIAFAESRDDFQQKINAYCQANQCTLTSQLSPLPVILWFQRHNFNAEIWRHSLQLENDECYFILQDDKTHLIEQQNYLIHQTIKITPLPDVFHLSESVLSTPYLPDELMDKVFFEQLNLWDNPKEGLKYENSHFNYRAETYRYYAIVDGVKSFFLPQLCEKEGRTESLYKGELQKTMGTNVPYLTQLTVSDRNTSEFVHLLFAQSEQPWFGLWDLNPAIFIRCRQSFDDIHYHFRKFTHLYNEKTEKWYFFRFYDPTVLVDYLQYIANEPTRLASFFGYRNGNLLIESIAARVDDHFHIFNLKDLPIDTEPSAVNFDEFLQGFLDKLAHHKLFNKIIKIAVREEFPGYHFAEGELKKYFNYAWDLGFTLEGSLINLVKAQCYLSGDTETLKLYWNEIKKEYGNDLTETELGELLFERTKTLA